jgi:hypothetical protein
MYNDIDSVTQKYFIVSGIVTLKICTQMEEMVNSMTRRKYNCSMIQDRNLLLTEFFSGITFNFNKRAKNNIYAIFGSDIIVGRFF